MDDSTIPAVLTEVQAAVAALVSWLTQTPDLDLATAETVTLARLRTVGARVLAAGLAARGPGKADGPVTCGCGAAARFEGYRAKGVQTLLGWITVRRAYTRCPDCGARRLPRDATLGLARDSHSPGVRRLASRFGALLPVAQAAATLHEAAGVQLSARTVRSVTERVGAAREQAITAAVAHAWADGWPSPTTTADPVPERCYVAMDGVRILSTDGAGREAKLGMVVPVRGAPDGERREPARYTASFEAADAFGRRLALVAHDQHVETAATVAVLGDGAAWIWNLADEHFPGATQIVDWYHASERIWALGRALYGADTPATATWVETHLRALAAGQAATLAAAWTQLPCRGEATTVRDEQVTYFTNQASRMAYDQYRAAGWDIGSGMIE
ncbi:MAG: ISKra4 family transposase, partial [Chloroflexota bacterium]|nr:ISKra4 family transposase [Chloroflexota bacterium]